VVHDLADLLSVRAGKRSTEHGEILREEEDGASVDAAVAGDYAVSEDVALLHPEVGAAVCLEAVELAEGSGIEENLEPLPRRELPRPVLPLDSLGPPSELCAGVQLVELLDLLLDRQI
jgi:hypothetical protein